VKSIADVLWRCEPLIAAVTIEEVVMTVGLDLLAEDLTAHTTARKLLRVTTVADAEVLFVSCVIADRYTRVDFSEPSAATLLLTPLRTALIAAILRRGARNSLLKREVGFRPSRS
jgi:hypothetical protein